MAEPPEESEPRHDLPSARLAKLHQQIESCIEEMSGSDADAAILRFRGLLKQLSEETNRLQQASKTVDRDAGEGLEGEAPGAGG